jgi:hypothetical protein
MGCHYHTKVPAVSKKKPPSGQIRSREPLSGPARCHSSDPEVCLPYSPRLRDPRLVPKIKFESPNDCEEQHHGEKTGHRRTIGLRTSRKRCCALQNHPQATMAILFPSFRGVRGNGGHSFSSLFSFFSSEERLFRNSFIIWCTIDFDRYSRIAPVIQLLAVVCICSSKVQITRQQGRVVPFIAKTKGTSLCSCSCFMFIPVSRIKMMFEN